MKRPIKRKGLRSPPRGPKMLEKPMSSEHPAKLLSERFSMVKFANSLLKAELARQRALTADVFYRISEKV